MREREYVKGLLASLLQSGTLTRSDAILVVGAHVAEDELFTEMGFQNVLLTNIQPFADKTRNRSEVQDAMHLKYVDNSFQFGVVLNSLHHMSRPHLALTELYRVSSKGVLGLESNDCWFLRLLVRMNLTLDYELSIDGTQDPNYIYRWTKRELEKTIHSFSPHSLGKVDYHYSFHLPTEGITRLLGLVFLPLLLLLKAARQTNTFAFVLHKSHETKTS